MLNYLIALYHVSRDYHSGQSSRGYELCCLAGRYCKRWYGVDPGQIEQLNHQQSIIYFKLAEKHQRWL